MIPAEVVTQLIEDVATLKESLVSQRWQQVADNFVTINQGLQSLHERIAAVEARLDGVTRND